MKIYSKKKGIVIPIIVVAVIIATVIFIHRKRGSAINDLATTKIEKISKLIEYSFKKSFNDASVYLNILKDFAEQGLIHADSLDLEKMNHIVAPFLKSNEQISTFVLARSDTNAVTLLKRQDINDIQDYWLNRFVYSKEGSIFMDTITWTGNYYNPKNIDTIVYGIRSEDPITKEEYNPTERPWFIHANDTSEYWTDLYNMFFRKDWGITVSMEAKSKSDNIDKTVVQFDILLPSIKDYAKEIVDNLYDNKEIVVFVLTKEGDFVNYIHKKAKDSVKDIIIEYTEVKYKDTDTVLIKCFSKIKGLTEQKIFINKLVDKNSEDSIISISNENEVKKFRVDNNTYFGIVRKISLSKDQFFYMGVVIPEPEIIKQARLFYILGLAVIVIFLIIYWLTWKKNKKKIQKQKEEMQKQKELIAKLKMKKMAVKSAISTILGRNISHTFGSHVLPGLNNELFLSKYEKGEYLSNYERAIIAFKKKYSNIKNVNNHLQERMEFIADISSSEKPTFASTFNFNGVINELFSETNIDNQKFLKYISNNLKVRNNLISKIDNIRNEEIQVSLPNDSLGKQAFYSILISLIRNAVKHSRAKSESKIIQLYTIVNEPDNTIFKDKYFCVDIIETFVGSTLKLDSNIVSYLNNKLKQTIIDEKSNEIQEGAWGLLEMKIAATYLRMSSMDEIDKNELSFISANFYNNNNEIIPYYEKEANLGFRIYLLKPQICLFLINQELKLQDKREKVLNSWGIDIKNSGEKQHNNSKENNFYKFIVYHNKNKAKAEKSSNKSNRFLSLTEEKHTEFLNLLEKDDFKTIMNFLWENWVYNLYGNDELPEIQFKKFKDTNKKTAFFDHHGTVYKKGEIKVENKNIYYYEPYPSTSFTNILKRYFDEKQSKSRLEFEIIESIKTKIVVIDDRIQKISENLDNNIKISELNIKQILKLMRIEVPDPIKINLNKYGNSEIFRNKLEKYIIEKLKDEESRFIIIHITLFEYLCYNENKEKAGLQKKLKEFEKYTTRGKNIVLTSGKGTPANLPDNCYFIHFSTLQNYIIANRSKFLLNNALYSLTKKK